MAEELLVSKIKQGTVIDHIKAGMAPTVLRILGIDRGCPDVVVMAMNVKSGKLGHKDVVKVENRILSEGLLRKIAIVSPDATVNIIREFKVAEKRAVELPKEVKGIVKCPNRNCITNSEERVESYFVIESRAPLLLRCHYCEELVEGEKVEIL